MNFKVFVKGVFSGIIAVRIQSYLTELPYSNSSLKAEFLNRCCYLIGKLGSSEPKNGCKTL